MLSSTWQEGVLKGRSLLIGIRHLGAGCGPEGQPRQAGWGQIGEDMALEEVGCRGLTEGPWTRMCSHQDHRLQLADAVCQHLDANTAPVPSTL